MFRKAAVALLLCVAWTAPAAEGPGWFGLSFSFHRTAGDGAFLRVCAVAPNGPAAAAGLQAGDLITHVGGKPVAFRTTMRRCGISPR